ncbi:alternative ribosome rescue aminoacyl-tRNA hydrolase ArfB [Hyphobacterium marinum]|uniref:Alternative ribosome rescue aminoacyl-tRNA hydrolase ArfB n=1 Tax=Hyphobacterium marinum TaxID=3116574 RepID=A0ABU7M084_9PROT|nr:alternative ribosome rescue aminoacyl-tRNA hydrolase ArfB [Hyphobacterium sp. Y6023]MEE2567203.1 alternative ribosome rescue aminoacyl-tRNA hydrolase ArfB [Hyphobacterium sp. Y6023]
MRVTDTIFIDESELEERFVRASGPGGQHVNKTSSAVQLRFDAANSPNLSDEVKFRLKRVAGRRMTKDGILIIEADGSRSQERNRAAARERLAALIEKATHRPKPRKKSRPSLASIRKTKEAKAQRAQKKSLRQKPSLND